MTAKTTRTINPLHFEDLEPHRFEDLVRQLVYNFREWHDLEATGRGGADDGIDIRALERLPDTLGESLQQDEDAEPPFIEREWRIQCKRERRIGPKKMEEMVDALLRSDRAPHGVMVCAACDFSKATRDRFRLLLAEAGVEEFFLWGKAELEDRLFQPPNDHLLWAYFGISIRVRRRSLRTELRSRLSTKKQLSRVLGAPAEQPDKSTVFLRDAEARDYTESPREHESNGGRWGYYTFEGHIWPEMLGFVTRVHFAVWDREAGEYDYYEPVDTSQPDLYEVGIMENRVNEEEGNARNYWIAKIPPDQRAIVKELSVIHYDQVLAIDELGDSINPGPHIFIDFEGRDTPFRKSRWFLVEREHGAQEHTPLDDLKRISRFPTTLPEVSWEEAREAWESL